MPTDTDFSEAYEWALEHAAIQSRGRGADLAEVAHDAATDGVVWARDNYNPAKGAFCPFSAAIVRRCVSRAIQAHNRRDRPSVFSLDLDDGRADIAAEAEPGPMTIGDLPDDLAFIVRLYMVDGYTMREIAMLVGCVPDTVQQKLRKAAGLLAPGRTPPTRKAGEKRLSGGSRLSTGRRVEP